MTRAVDEPTPIRRERRTERRTPAILARGHFTRFAIVDAQVVVAHRGVVDPLPATFGEPDPARILPERDAHLARDVGRPRSTASASAGIGRRTNQLLPLSAVHVIHPDLRIARGDDVLPVRREVR